MFHRHENCVAIVGDLCNRFFCSKFEDGRSSNRRGFVDAPETQRCDVRSSAVGGIDNSHPQNAFLTWLRISSIAVLSGLERCEMAFETPLVLRIRPVVICRISTFDDVLERSVSRGSSIDCEKQPYRQSDSDASDASSISSTSSTGEGQIKRKPVPQTPPQSSESISAKTRAPPKTVAPLLNQGNWNSAWAHFVQETGGRPLRPSPSQFSNNNSDYSLSSSSSSTTERSATSSTCSLHSSGSGKAKPSSSISSSSKRSPLSTMRWVQYSHTKHPF
jgi:hypothetical protein